jgi:hypothetical protein
LLIYHFCNSFLPDDQYGIALDNLVKGCTDILLLDPTGTKIFTGKRCVQPQPDWWFLGGRIFPGETPIQSSQRLLKREMGLDIDDNRFRPVCCQAFAFEMRGTLYIRAFDFFISLSHTLLQYFVSLVLKKKLSFF